MQSFIHKKMYLYSHKYVLHLCFIYNYIFTKCINVQIYALNAHIAARN